MRIEVGPVEGRRVLDRGEGVVGHQRHQCAIGDDRPARRARRRSPRCCDPVLLRRADRSTRVRKPQHTAPLTARAISSRTGLKDPSRSIPVVLWTRLTRCETVSTAANADANRHVVTARHRRRPGREVGRRAETRVGPPRGPHTSRLIDGGSMTAMPGHCPWAAYFASTSALSGRHQASLFRYQSMVACRPERKSVNFGAQPSSSTSLELSMA